MTPPRWRLSLPALLLWLVSLSGVVGAAPQLAVFPFVSEDPRLGFAVADRLTQAFSAPKVPPELALGLVPPFVLQDGQFISPLTLLGQPQSGSRHAAVLLRELLGTEVVVTGRVRYRENSLELQLFIARERASYSLYLQAPETEPASLIRQARAVLYAYTGLSPAPGAPLTFDLSSAYGTFIDGLMQLSAGQPEAALGLLENAERAADAETRWRRRAAALRAVLTGGGASATPLLAGVVELSRDPFDAQRIRRAFAGSEEPLAGLWDVLLLLQEGNEGGARQALSALETARYPFAEVEALLYEVRSAEARTHAETDLMALLARQPASLAAHLAGLLVAQTLQDTALEREVATRLRELAPAFAYPYERLSQAAFAQNDALAAATALKTATRLEPASSLYWTNLGWAYYLLGVLEQSESASRRAGQLDDNDYISRYNLGLVQVVSGRLTQALNTYDEALARDLLADDALDPAAIDDLLGALERYPGVPAIHYALATLYEVKGELGAAASAYERYVELGGGSLVAEARARAEVLRAPPAPFAIGPEVRVGVGADTLDVPAYVPGDILYPRFELSTEGEELPTPLSVELRLKDASGRVLAQAAGSERLRLPPGTVALELDSVSLELPRTLRPGRYGLELRARARGREALRRVPLTVAAPPAPLVRQLLGRGIILRELQSAQPLYPQDAAQATTDQTFIATLLGELEQNATAAAETLPEITQGRFAGQSGEALFASSGPQDIRDFLAFLLARAAGTDASFADLYANWALEGAPRR